MWADNRYRATLSNLKDCIEHLENPTSPEEEEAKTELIELIGKFVFERRDGNQETQGG
jgi:hypothetical protein